MTVYTELENGSVTDGTLFIPNDPLNRDWQRVQQEVLDAVSTITPYAGSAEELAAAISEKVNELRDYFYGLYGMTLENALAMSAYFDPLDPPSPISAKFHADIAIAEAARLTIEALLDVPSVDAYDVSTDPSWTP